MKAPVDKGGLGFQRLVLSDWWAMPGDQESRSAANIVGHSVTNEAVQAGLDVEVPWTLHYSIATLQNADQSLVDEAARRVLDRNIASKPRKRLTAGAQSADF